MGLVGGQGHRHLLGAVARDVEDDLHHLGRLEVPANLRDELGCDLGRLGDDGVGQPQGDLVPLRQVGRLVPVDLVEHRLVGAPADGLDRAGRLADAAVVLASPSQPHQLGGNRV